MARLRNNALRYGLVAMTLHWLIAGLIIFMVGFGYYLTTLGFGDIQPMGDLRFLQCLHSRRKRNLGEGFHRSS